MNLERALALVGVGLAQLFAAYSWVYRILQVVSLAYLLYLAWKIATAAGPGSAVADGTPLSFIQAALFQWVNPKAWAMALTAMSVYAPSTEIGSVLLVAGAFGLVNFPCISLWACWVSRHSACLLTGDGYGYLTE